MYFPMTTAFILFHLIVHKTVSADFKGVKEWKQGCTKNKVCFKDSSCRTGRVDPTTLYNVEVSDDIEDSCQLAIAFRRLNADKIRLEILIGPEFKNRATFTNAALEIDTDSWTCDGIKSTNPNINSRMIEGFAYCEFDYSNAKFESDYIKLTYGDGSNTKDSKAYVAVRAVISRFCPTNAHAIITNCPEGTECTDVRLEEVPDKMTFNCEDSTYRIQYEAGKNDWKDADGEKITCEKGDDAPKWSTSKAPKMRCIKYTPSESGSRPDNGPPSGNNTSFDNDTSRRDQDSKNWSSIVLGCVGGFVLIGGIIGALFLIVEKIKRRQYDNMGLLLFPVDQHWQMKKTAAGSNIYKEKRKIYNSNKEDLYYRLAAIGLPEGSKLDFEPNYKLVKSKKAITVKATYEGDLPDGYLRTPFCVTTEKPSSDPNVSVAHKYIKKSEIFPVNFLDEKGQMIEVDADIGEGKTEAESNVETKTEDPKTEAEEQSAQPKKSKKGAPSTPSKKDKVKKSAKEKGGKKKK